MNRVFSLIGMVALVFGLAILVSFSDPVSSAISPASATLVAVPSPGSFSPTPEMGELIITSPESGEGYPVNRDGYVYAVQVGDGTPIEYAHVKVDNGPWVLVEAKDISFINMPPHPNSNLGSRLITFGSLFAWRPDGQHQLGGGSHTIRLKLKTTFGEFESDPVTYSLIGAPTTFTWDDGAYSNGFASFDAAMGMDCKKRKICTREIIYYIPMGPNDSKSFDEKVAEANATKAKAVEAILKYACMDIKITYKSLSIPAGAKGYNPATGVVTNVADFFHSLHSDNDAKVSEPGKSPKSFKDEMKSWKQSGPIPFIGADDVAASNPNEPGSMIAGLTFKACTGTQYSDAGKPTGNCPAQSKVFTIVSARKNPENMQHELGHRLFEDADWPIAGNNGVQQHHMFDFKDPDTPLSSNNFMQDDLPSEKLTITKKQAEGMYAACKEHGGSLASNNHPSSNYCTYANLPGITAPVLVCQHDGGNQNEESCWGNTARGFKPKVPSNYDPGHDYCPVNNDCPVGLKCVVSTCHCVPDWWPDSDDSGVGEGDPLGVGSNGADVGKNGGVGSSSGNGGIL